MYKPVEKREVGDVVKVSFMGCSLYAEVVINNEKMIGYNGLKSNDPKIQKAVRQ